MIAVIIQARMGSTRLPGKVLKLIGGRPMLAIQVERAKQAKLADRVIVATSISAQDDQIAEFCRKIGVDCFRGAEDDVLTRYYECARQYRADVVVRLTADCPLIDPAVIDSVIQLYLDEKVDYAANAVPPETSMFPDGSDVEVFSWQALARACQEAQDPHDREHVTFYFWKYDNGFTLAQMKQVKNWSKYRFTVDYPEDYEVVGEIIKELNDRGQFGHLAEIIDILDSNPELIKKNSQYYYGIGWKKS
jgi:spore coat polysaccharide biosynthesis protein SpsF